MRTIIPICIHDFWLTLVRADDGLLLIDSGDPGVLPDLEEALSRHGCALADLRWLLITHHDWDHMGGARELAEACPGLEILASAPQVPYLTGREKSLRLLWAEAALAAASPEGRAAARAEVDMMAAVRPVERVTAVAPGRILPICGGVEVVDTDGHHPGHISVLFRPEKTLVAGDAMGLDGGRLRVNPLYALDMPRAVAAVRPLLDLELEQVICYHGGVFHGDVRAALRDLLGAQG